MRKFFTRNLIIALTVLGGFSQAFGQVPTVAWAENIGSSGEEFTDAVVSDASGNVYVSGRFTTALTLGSTTLTPVGTFDMYIAKYDGNGNFQWVIQGNSTDSYGEMIGLDLAVDNSGNLVVAGRFSDFGSGGASLDGTSISSNGEVNIFAARISPAGNVLNTISFGSGGIFENTAYAVTVDDNGSTFLTGTFAESVNFGANTLHSLLAQSVFLAKLSPSFVGAGAVEYGDTTSFSRGTGLDYDNGKIFATGIFDSRITFDGNSFNGQGSNDVWVARIDTNNTFDWAQVGGGSNEDGSEGIAVDNNGDVFITGFYGGTATFGSNNLTSNAQENVFIAKYSAAGSLSAIEDPKSKGFNGMSRGTGIDASDNIVISGNYMDSLTFNNISGLNSGGGRPAGFGALFSSSLVDQAAISGGGEMADASKGPNSVNYLTGRYDSLAQLGGITLVGQGVFDGFVFEMNNGPNSVEDGLTSFGSIEAYPNPFMANSRATVDMTSGREASVILVDLQGRVVNTLFEGYLPRGTHHFDLDGENLPVGMYFLALTSGEERMLVRVVKAR